MEEGADASHTRVVELLVPARFITKYHLRQLRVYFPRIHTEGGFSRWLRIRIQIRIEAQIPLLHTDIDASPPLFEAGFAREIATTLDAVSSSEEVFFRMN